MSVTVGYMVFDCDAFEHDGEQRTVKAIIGPLRVVEDFQDGGRAENTVYSGCSAHFNCENPNCIYSRLSRGMRKGERDGAKHDRPAKNSRVRQFLSG